MLFTRLSESWDSICHECGQCCCEKIPARLLKTRNRRIPGVLSVNRHYFIDYTKPCSYLDIETGDCMVYPQRFRVCSSCIPMTIFHAFFADYLPDNCGYVVKFRFWRKHKKEIELSCKSTAASAAGRSGAQRHQVNG